MALGLVTATPATATDTFNWRTNQNLVSADIQSGELSKLLEQVASLTGWQVFLEPGTTRAVSAKFNNLPPGEALRLLLGELNFALVPETNASPKLFVFRTSRQNATLLVRPARAAESGSQAKLIPNELIVRLKPGAKIDELARLLGAAPPPQLQLKPPPADGRIIVGLVDTAVQPLGGNLDSFLLKQLSVAGEAELDPNSPLHGTAMAETILRSIQAMTKGSSSVQILPVDVYGPNPSTTTFEVAKGIAEAVNGGARLINLSLGSDGDSPFLHGVIQDASAKNIVFFGATAHSCTASSRTRALRTLSFSGLPGTRPSPRRFIRRPIKR